MPFGFFGSAAALVLLGVVMPLLFAFVWPGAVARPALFLAVMIASGVVSGIALFWWHASPMTNMGIAGERGAGNQSWHEFQTMLQTRYVWAAAGVVGTQLLLCAVLRMLLGRSASV
jgi:hypothetical protein